MSASMEIMVALAGVLLLAAVAAEASAPMDALDSCAATSVIARLSFGTALPVSDSSRSSM